MDCPRCVRPGRSAAYRGVAAPDAVVPLVPERHAANVTIARCPSCRGAFAEHAALIAIENAARGNRNRGASRAEAARRAYDPPTPAIACPSCSAETIRREWGIGTLLFVDVCVECRGVWLDGGELEAIGISV